MKVRGEFAFSRRTDKSRWLPYVRQEHPLLGRQLVYRRWSSRAKPHTEAQTKKVYMMCMHPTALSLTG